MMKLSYQWILSILMTTLFLFTACEKEEITTYESNESKVYFQSQNFSSSNGTIGYTTKMSFSFVGRGDNWSSVIFGGTVQLLGKVEDYDRAVKVVVDTENTTMIEGEDYEIDLDTLRIKAGSNQGNIGVLFIRNKSLQKEAKKLVLKLEPNENFTVLEKYKSVNTWSNTTADYLDGSRYTFIIDEVYSEPGGWATVSANTFFGTWTPAKYIFINKFFGFSLDDWTYVNGYGSKISKGRMSYFARQLQKELQRIADDPSLSPVLDEDGSYMQLPSPYQINYSNVQP